MLNNYFFALYSMLWGFIEMPKMPKKKKMPKMPKVSKMPKIVEFYLLIFKIDGVKRDHNFRHFRHFSSL